MRRFVRDIPAADVLTLRRLTRDPARHELLDGPELAGGTVVRDAVRTVLSADRPVRVIEGGRLLGVITAADLVPALSGPAA